MEKVQKWANLIGVISAVIALASLAVTVGNMRSDAVKARTNEWQEVAVFSIISEAKLEGISFADIQSQYKTKAADLPDELPRTEIQTQALKRVLLSLLAKRAISVRSDNRYGVALEPTPYQAHGEYEKDLRINEIGDEVFKIVSEQPGRYTKEELATLLRGRFEFTDVEFGKLLIEMEQLGAIKTDSDGKLSGPPRVPPKK
jgi:hypothetical protein